MLVVATLLSLAAAPPAHATATTARARTYLQNFKDMALSRCIATAYSASPDAARDASASAGGFFEWGSYDIDKGTEGLDTLIEATLAQPYGSFQGPSVRLDLMKCLDMYHGDALAKLARRVVDKPNRTSLQDYPEAK